MLTIEKIYLDIYIVIVILIGVDDDGDWNMA